MQFFRLFDAAGTRLVSLYRQNQDADKIRITHSGSGVSTTGRLPLDTWGRIELHVVVAGTASTIVVKVDGVEIYRTAAASLGTAGVTTVQLGNNTAGQAFRLVADDVVARAGS